MILARTVRDGCCRLNSFSGTSWLSSLRWKDGFWRYALVKTTEFVLHEEVLSVPDVMARVLGSFGIMDDFSLFDAAELERLLSPDSMRELSLVLEVMGS